MLCGKLYTISEPSIITWSQKRLLKSVQSIMTLSFWWFSSIFPKGKPQYFLQTSHNHALKIISTIHHHNYSHFTQNCDTLSGEIDYFIIMCVDEALLIEPAVRYQYGNGHSHRVVPATSCYKLLTLVWTLLHCGNINQMRAPLFQSPLMQRQKDDSLTIDHWR